MGTKVFLTTNNGAQLISDERDIMVSNQLINRVIEWCEKTGIKAEQVVIYPTLQWTLGVNLWRVKDERHRALFILRWS